MSPVSCELPHQYIYNSQTTNNASRANLLVIHWPCTAKLWVAQAICRSQSATRRPYLCSTAAGPKDFREHCNKTKHHYIYLFSLECVVTCAVWNPNNLCATLVIGKVSTGVAARGALWCGVANLEKNASEPVSKTWFTKLPTSVS